MIVMPKQVKQARELLGWSVSTLAERSKLSHDTIKNFENNVHPLSALNVAAIRIALEAAGAEFTDGEQQSEKLKEDQTHNAPRWLSGVLLLIVATIAIWALISMLWPPP